MIIEVKGISKKYMIPRSGRARYPLFKEELASRFQRSVKRILHPVAAPKHDLAQQEIWALRDVSFSVKKGEVVGIVGRNGAGKSTLLKILSGITYPTEGIRIVRGRVGTLLQIGTGFHDELTGLENIFLNGAILGMRRREIRAKLDEITEFSGIEQFLETPIKRYSMGMKQRLAFAVAAHFEPEILLLDEALAVGDIEFQKKCREKMQEISSRTGKTILLVSHEFSLLQDLCRRCVLIEHGKLIGDGASDDIIQEYLNLISVSSLPLLDRSDRRGDGSLMFSAFSLLDNRGEISREARVGEECALRFNFVNNSSRPMRNLKFVVQIVNQAGQYIAYFSNEILGKKIETFEGPEGIVTVSLPKLSLPPGNYIIDVEAYSCEKLVDQLKHAASLIVGGGDFYGFGILPRPGQSMLLMDYQLELA